MSTEQISPNRCESIPPIPYQPSLISHHCSPRLRNCMLKRFPADLNRWDSQGLINEASSLCIDSPFDGGGRCRRPILVICGSAFGIDAVETGASRREAAERFEGERELGDKACAALARQKERRAQAARRKHFSVGGVRGRGLGAD